MDGCYMVYRDSPSGPHMELFEDLRGVVRYLDHMFTLMERRTQNTKVATALRRHVREHLTTETKFFDLLAPFAATGSEFWVEFFVYDDPVWTVDREGKPLAF